MNLGHHHKPSINLSEDMDDHCCHPRAFHQLEDADVILPQPVVADELDPAVAVEASGVARMVVPDIPLVFPPWSEEQDVMGSSLKVICSKFMVDGLHCKGRTDSALTAVKHRTVGLQSECQTSATKFTILTTDYM